MHFIAFIYGGANSVTDLGAAKVNPLITAQQASP